MKIKLSLFSTLGKWCAKFKVAWSSLWQLFVQQSSVEAVSFGGLRVPLTSSLQYNYSKIPHLEKIRTPTTTNLNKIGLAIIQQRALGETLWEKKKKNRELRGVTAASIIMSMKPNTHLQMNPCGSLYPKNTAVRKHILTKPWLWSWQRTSKQNLHINEVGN